MTLENTGKAIVVRKNPKFSLFRLMCSVYQLTEAGGREGCWGGSFAVRVSETLEVVALCTEHFNFELPL
jgi:hypothetical protein